MHPVLALSLTAWYKAGIGQFVAWLLCGISPLWWLFHKTTLQLAHDVSVPPRTLAMSCQQLMDQ